MDGVNADNTYVFSIAQLNINIHGYKTYSQEDCSSLRRKPDPTIVHFLERLKTCHVLVLGTRCSQIFAGYA